MKFENEELFWNEIKDYKLNLFLGAGFSVLAKNKFEESLPLRDKLHQKLIARFDLQRFAEKPFPFLCSHLKRTKQGELQSFLKEIYTVTSFADVYSHLDKLSIENVFTLNVDDLFEKIYESTRLSQYVCDVDVTGYTENPGINLFKLHGSVRSSFEKPMTFTAEDLANLFRVDSAIWNNVSFKIAARPTIFWGVNVEQDSNLISLLSSFQIKGRPTRPKWMVILPDSKYDIDEEEFQMMGFRIIRADTRELIEYFALGKTPSTTIAAKPAYDYDGLFPKECVSAILRSKYPVRPIAFFYQGFEPTWEEIISDKITRISFYNKAVNHIQQKRRLHITGSPGCGRTTLLMQLASAPELKGIKFFFFDLSAEKALFLKGKILGEKNVIIFLDNLSNSVDAYAILNDLSNIKLITADMDLHYEKIKHKISMPQDDCIDISDLLDSDIQKICESMHRPIQRFDNERVSLFEIVYRLWEGIKLQEKIPRMVVEVQSQGADLLEFYVLMSYVRFCNVSANMDMLFSYYADKAGFHYKDIYEMVSRLSSLIDISSEESGEPQDTYSLRSRIFAKLSIENFPPEVFGKMLNTFHKNVSRAEIRRYDIFRKKAYDADITKLAFPNLDDGQQFYDQLIERDYNPYVKHQYAIYLNRKGAKELAWEQIDKAYTQCGGEIFSIANTHAMILFENNIDKDEDSSGTVGQTLAKSFEVLERCLQLDIRKSYHIIIYARHAMRYASKMTNAKTFTYLSNAKQYIKDELAKAQYIPHTIRRALGDLLSECTTMLSKLESADTRRVK